MPQFITCAYLTLGLGPATSTQSKRCCADGGHADDSLTVSVLDAHTFTLIIIRPVETPQAHQHAQIQCILDSFWFGQYGIRMAVRAGFGRSLSERDEILLISFEHKMFMHASK